MRTAEFFRCILDSLNERIVIIDESGAIQYANAAWIDFGTANECTSASGWIGVNYLEVCDGSALAGEVHARLAAAGTRSVINGEVADFSYEYPCHGRAIRRWFVMRVTPLRWDGAPCFVISHQDITERKLAERKVKALSLLDGLTGLANRRYFDKFLRKEWRRAGRANSCLSLILLDVDHFKQFNDRYGHQAGDDCLKMIGSVLAGFGKRPGDLPARYGGEEFAIILGDTDLGQSRKIAQSVLDAIREMEVALDDHAKSSEVTASLGVAMLYPNKDQPEKTIISLADAALYEAKRSGRNRVAISEGLVSARSDG